MIQYGSVLTTITASFRTERGYIVWGQGNMMVAYDGLLNKKGGMKWVTSFLGALHRNALKTER